MAYSRKTTEELHRFAILANDFGQFSEPERQNALVLMDLVLLRPTPSTSTCSHLILELFSTSFLRWRARFKRRMAVLLALKLSLQSVQIHDLPYQWYMGTNGIMYHIMLPGWTSFAA
ncbi:unnamed protein product [Nesidiocoris tenuis]|uniref:Uncharacterized protein n=1 Tax=Nesidiocoris tenuis TaxID=355587 RepID=A0A6H5FXE7_9HEMI|nr:unnamed protein product [Nesidiocoris tenuis]